MAAYDKEIAVPTLANVLADRSGNTQDWRRGYRTITDIFKNRITEQIAKGDMICDRFNALQFYDLILSQGLLPPDLIREAVMK